MRRSLSDMSTATVPLTVESLQAQMKAAGQMVQTKPAQFHRSVSLNVIGMDTENAISPDESSLSSYPGTPTSAISFRSKSASPSPRAESPSLLLSKSATSAKHFTQLLAKEDHPMEGSTRVTFIPPSNRVTDDRRWYLPANSTKKEYTHTYLNGGAACLPCPEVLPANRIIWTAFRQASVSLTSNQNCINAEAEPEYYIFSELDFPDGFVRPSRAFLRRILLVFQRKLAECYPNIPFVVLPSMKFVAAQGAGATCFVPVESPNVHIVFRNLQVDRDVICTLRLIIIEALEAEFHRDYPALKWAEIFDPEPFKPIKPHLRQNFSYKCTKCEFCDGQRSSSGRKSCAHEFCVNGLVYDRSVYKVVGIMNEAGQFWSTNFTNQSEPEYRDEGVVLPRICGTDGKMHVAKMTLQHMFNRMLPQKPTYVTSILTVKSLNYPNYVFELEMTNIRIETASRLLTPVVIPADAPSAFDKEGNLMLGKPHDHTMPSENDAEANKSGKNGKVTFTPISITDERVLILHRYFCKQEPRLWKDAKIRSAHECELIDKDGQRIPGFKVWTNSRNCKNRKIRPATGLPMHTSKNIGWFATPRWLYQKCVGDNLSNNCINGVCGRGRSHARYDLQEMPVADYLKAFKVKHIVRRRTDLSILHEKLAEEFANFPENQSHPQYSKSEVSFIRSLSAVKSEKAALTDISNLRTTHQVKLETMSGTSPNVTHPVSIKTEFAVKAEDRDTDTLMEESSLSLQPADPEAAEKERKKAIRERVKRGLQMAEEAMQRQFKKARLDVPSNGAAKSQFIATDSSTKQLVKYGLVGKILAAPTVLASAPLSSTVAKDKSGKKRKKNEQSSSKGAKAARNDKIMSK